MNGLSDFHRSCQMKSAVRHIAATKSNEKISAEQITGNPNEPIT